MFSSIVNKIIIVLTARRESSTLQSNQSIRESHMDFNNPKVRQAQYIADVMCQDQAILLNMFGGYDIKRASAVEHTNNPNLLCIIEPKVARQKCAMV